MTTPVSNINRTNLSALDPNLATGQVADPALRKACFDEIYNYFDTFVTSYNAFIANGGIATANIADLSVTTAKLALLAVTAAQIADATITTGKIAIGGVTSTNILDGTIITADLADNAISTAKITDLAVSTAKIALLAIGTAQLADGAVTSAKIADGTIVDADINSAAVIAWTKISKTSSSLADLATRLASDLTGTLNVAQLPAFTGHVTTSAGSSVTTISSGAVTSAMIADGTIVDADINAAAAITWAKISKTASSLADLATRSASDLNSGTLNVARLPSAIPAINIGNGDVDNTELSYLNNVTSNVQTQLNAKATIAFPNIAVPSQTTVTAGSATDTLNITGTGSVVVTTNNTTKTVNIDVSGLGTGTVNSVTSANADISVANTTTNPVLTLNRSAISNYAPVGQTIVVAASNSSHTTRADYLCTGTSDQTTINAAISALPILVVEDGTATAGAASTVTLGSNASAINNYYVGYTIVITGGTGSGQSNTIISYVASTKVATVSSAWGTIPANGSTYNITTPSGKVVLLEGLYSISNAITVPNNVSLEGQGNGTLIKLASGTNTTLNLIQNIDQTNGNNGICISNLKVDGNRANNSGTNSAVRLTNANEVTLQNLTLVRMSNNGIVIVTSSNITIANNICLENGGMGVNLSGATYCTVTGNIFRGNTGAGIYMTSNAYYNTITGNICQNNTNTGISLNATSYHNTITGNICQNNTNHGIYLASSYNNIISGNTCQDNSVHGIFNNGNNNNTITGNKCQGNSTGNGIYFVSCSNNTLSSNTCQGNGTNGIYSTGGSNNTLSSNTCQGNGTNGISIASSGNNNTITCNTCVENSQTTTNTYDNINIDSSSNTNNIQGNTCRKGATTNLPRYGIRINASTCTGNLVTNNDLTTGGSTGAYSDLGTSTITTAGNKLA